MFVVEQASRYTDPHGGVTRRSASPLPYRVIIRLLLSLDKFLGILGRRRVVDRA
jgi:hypothetical protein